MSSAMRAAAAVHVRHLKKNALNRFIYDTARGMASLSGGQLLSKHAEETPFKNAIRFDHKNHKFDFREMEKWSTYLACGLTEQRFQVGDVILSWLPQHFSEQVVLEFACSKAGFILYKLDPALAITDTEAAKAALKEALEVTEANILITQEAGSDVNYVNIVKEVVPEIRVWDFAEGRPFFSPRFPHLRYPIHTGLDYRDKMGMIPYKQMLSDKKYLLAPYSSKHHIDGNTPLAGELNMGPGGITKGKILSNDEVVEQHFWPLYSSVLKKEFLNIEGVGNIW